MIVGEAVTIGIVPVPPLDELIEVAKLVICDTGDDPEERIPAVTVGETVVPVLPVGTDELTKLLSVLAPVGLPETPEINVEEPVDDADALALIPLMVDPVPLMLVTKDVEMDKVLDAVDWPVAELANVGLFVAVGNPVEADVTLGLVALLPKLVTLDVAVGNPLDAVDGALVEPPKVGLLVAVGNPVEADVTLIPKLVIVDVATDDALGAVD